MSSRVRIVEYKDGKSAVCFDSPSCDWLKWANQCLPGAVWEISRRKHKSDRRELRGKLGGRIDVLVSIDNIDEECPQILIFIRGTCVDFVRGLSPVQTFRELVRCLWEVYVNAALDVNAISHAVGQPPLLQIDLTKPWGVDAS